MFDLIARRILEKIFDTRELSSETCDGDHYLKSIYSAK